MWDLRANSETRDHLTICIIKSKTVRGEVSWTGWEGGWSHLKISLARCLVSGQFASGRGGPHTVTCRREYSCSQKIHTEYLAVKGHFVHNELSDASEEKKSK